MTDVFGRQVIDSFSGEHEFLSNFYRRPVLIGGQLWPSAEHAYQAAKCVSEEEYLLFTDVRMTPGQAKRLGRRVTCWNTWESVKVNIMTEVVRAKFDDELLAEKLLATGDAILIEGNTWGDKFWGVCNGAGKNVLGNILMQVREEIKEKANAIPLQTRYS